MGKVVVFEFGSGAKKKSQNISVQHLIGSFIFRDSFKSSGTEAAI